MTRMEHLLIRLFLDRLNTALKQKPRISWIFRAPAGPLLIWLFFKVVVFEAWGRAGGLAGLGCVLLGVAGIWLSLFSLADLVAWIYYLARGRTTRSPAGDNIWLADQSE